MAIPRTALTDDDGSRTTGTIFNNAWQVQLYDAIDAAIDGASATVRSVAKGGTGAATLAAHGVVIGEGTSAVAVTGAGTVGQVLTSTGASADPTFQGPVVQTTTSTGTVNDFALTANAALLRLNNASLLTLTGFAAGYDGQEVTLVSVGAGQVDLSNQAAGSSAANRLINGVTCTRSLSPGSGVARIKYDLTTARWRVIDHEQGAWITQAYAAGTYTASGSQTWTVDAGDQTVFRYLLRGRTLIVEWAIDTSSVGGTPSPALQITAPNGCIANQLAVGVYYASDNGAAGVAAYCQIAAAGTLITLYKNITASGNWAAATNTTVVYGTLTFEVQ